jgi:inosose dehydratase
MPIRIGANPIGWSNDDMQEIGGKTPLSTCLAEAREAGMEGMELGNKFPREAGALKAALAPYGLACIGGWHSIELLNRSAARNSTSPSRIATC